MMFCRKKDLTDLVYCQLDIPRVVNTMPLINRYRVPLCSASIFVPSGIFIVANHHDLPLIPVNDNYSEGPLI